MMNWYSYINFPLQIQNQNQIPQNTINFVYYYFILDDLDEVMVWI